MSGAAGPQAVAGGRTQRRAGLAVSAVVLVAALVLVAGNAGGRPGLAAAVIVLQAVFGFAWLLLFTMTVDAAVIVGFAVVVADVVLLRTRTATGGSIVGVIGLSVIAVLFHQIARRSPRGVTDAVAITLSAIVLDAGLALLLPLRELAAGRSAVFAGVAGAASALIVVRLLPGSDPLRRLAGLIIALVVALACGLPAGGLTAPDASGVALASGVTVLLVDRLLERIPMPDSSERSARVYASVVAVVTGLVPLVLVGPIAYLAGRVIASGGV